MHDWCGPISEPGLFFADVEIRRPDGQSRLSEGQTYGGERVLFILPANSLNAALLGLLRDLKTDDVSLSGVHYSGPVCEFDPEVFDFKIDLAAMAASVRTSDTRQSSRGFIYQNDHDAGQGKLCSGMIDIYDPARPLEGRIYCGEFCNFAVADADPGAALLALLTNLGTRHAELRTLEEFGDRTTSDIEDDDELADMGREALQSGEIAFGEAFFYEPEKADR